MSEISPKGLTEAHLKLAGIGQDYWEVDFQNFQGPEKPKELSIVYLRNLQEMKEKGIGILYVGPNGPGKTTLGMIVMKYLIRANWNVFTTSLGEIVEQIQRTWKTSGDSGDSSDLFIGRCREADFLFIDDVGKEHRGASGFVQNTFDNLIRYRIQHRLPTFITTNHTKSELEAIYGESIMSLLDGKLKPVIVNGKDHRKTVQKEGIKSAWG